MAAAPLAPAGPEKDAAAALRRWAREEMELPPESLPPENVLRRLCSGSRASIWDFITQRVKHPRTVKKIRGNLRWYQHLEKGEEAKAEGAELKGALSRLRLEVEAGGGALGGAVEAAVAIEAQLEAGLAQRRAELRRGEELRQLGAEAARIRELLKEGWSLLLPPDRPEEAGLGVGFAINSGLEPEVLREVRAACRIRAQALEELLEPRPLAQRQQLMEAANQRWIRRAKEVLSRQAPGAVLWALKQLAEESRQEEWLGRGSAPAPEAPPTVRSLLQECWGVVGGLWGRVPPQAPPSPALQQLLGDGDSNTLQAARLALEAAGLEGARRGLARGVQELRGGPKAEGGPPPPHSQLGELRQRLQHGKRKTERRRCQLRALGGATRRLKAQLRPLQEEVRASGRIPPGLTGEAERLQQALGQLEALGALGEPCQGPSPDPLLPVSSILGVAQKSQQGALCQALALRHRLLRGAGPKPAGAGPEPAKHLPPESLSPTPEFLPRLRLVAARLQARLQAWPHLQALLSQWWELPAQQALALAPPPGGVPFAHWLQRWTQAAQALAEAQPRPPLPLAGAEEEGAEPLRSSDQ